MSPGNILVVLLGSIGDVTRALPVANLLRRGFPGAKITWSIEPPAYPLVLNHPAIDEAILLDRPRWWRSAAPFLREIRSRRFDLVLDLQRHLKSGLISWWSRAPDRLGFHPRDAKELNWLFNNRYIPEMGNGISKLEHYLKFVEVLGIKPEPIEWGFRLSAEEQGQVKRILEGVGDFAAFFLGSKWESKRWFPSETAACAAEIQSRYGLDIVLLGGGEDTRFADEVVSVRRFRGKNLAGKTSLREALGVLERARVAVGPDTGLMHLSAAVGTPVVSLWGATDPVRAGPYGYQDLVVRGEAPCSPCYLRRCPIGRVCMRSIAIEEVAAMVGKALSREK